MPLASCEEIRSPGKEQTGRMSSWMRKRRRGKPVSQSPSADTLACAVPCFNQRTSCLPSSATTKVAHPSIFAAGENGSPDLQQPLLQSEDSHQAQQSAQSKQSSRSNALVPHSINKIDWEDLWQTVIANCSEGFQCIWSESSQNPHVSQINLSITLMCREYSMSMIPKSEMLPKTTCQNFHVH